MKVLLAADIFPPESGGPATYVVTLANELVKQGVDVRIVSLNPNSDQSIVSCSMYRVSYTSKILRYLQYFWLLFREAKHANVVYAMGPVNAGFPALVAARFGKKKCVVKVVGDYAWEQGVQRYGVKELADEFQKNKYGWRVELLRWIEKHVVRNADAVITPCEYLKRMVMEWGAKEDRIFVVYNAVEMKIAAPAQKSAGEQWIVSAGRLVPWKGMAALIVVMPDILKEFPNAKLKIIGNGPQYNQLLSEVRPACRTGRCQKSDVPLLGNLSHEETASYIAAADVFVLNSGYEGLSHVLLEALSLGVPVLASRVGGNREVIPEDCLFAYNDVSEIKEKIINALKAKKIIPPLLGEGRVGSQRVPMQNVSILDKQKFSLPTMIEKTRELLACV